MRAGAGLHLDGEMAQAGDAREAGLVGLRRLGRVRDQRYHRRMVAGSDTPNMEIGDPVAAGLEPVANLFRNPAFGAHIEQHRAGGA